HEVSRAMRLVEGGRQGLEVSVKVAADVVLDPLPRAKHGEARPEPRHAVQRGKRENGGSVHGHHVGARARAQRVYRELDLPGNGERQAGGGGEAENPRRVAWSVWTGIHEEASSRGHPVSIPAPDRVMHLAIRLAPCEALLSSWANAGLPSYRWPRQDSMLFRLTALAERLGHSAAALDACGPAARTGPRMLGRRASDQKSFRRPRSHVS